MKEFLLVLTTWLVLCCLVQLTRIGTRIEVQTIYLKGMLK